MGHMKIIKSDQEHQQALEHLTGLIDKDLDQSKSGILADEIDVLAVLIERYEQERFVIKAPSAIDALKFRLEQQGMRQKDLIPYIGSASKVSEVLSGKRALSLKMIRNLSVGLGISADTLIQQSEKRDSKEKNVDWSAFPLAEMRKRNYFDEFGFTGSLLDLKEYSEEWIGRFLSTVPSGFSLSPILLRSSINLRTKTNKAMDSYALWAWQVRILGKANKNKLSTAYKTDTVNLQWMEKLAQLSWSEQGPSLAKEYLNKSGIHLVIEPHLSKTYLDGAVCICSNGNPVIGLTLRHDRLDNFWFTLMHELAHIALHLHGQDTWFIDDLDAAGDNVQEEEADDLAQRALLPKKIKASAVSDADVVRKLGAELNISPCIIAGRIRHETGNHGLFGRRFRTKVTPFL